jgi:hypothetical protein
MRACFAFSAALPPALPAGTIPLVPTLSHGPQDLTFKQESHGCVSAGHILPQWWKSHDEGRSALRNID